MDHIEESFQFSQELQNLMLDSPPPATGSSFTALLGLPPNQAAEILREGSGVAPINCSPTFPTNAELVDRAARFSVFAGESSPEESNSGEAFPANLKAEPVDYCGDKGKVAGSKRKDVEKSIKVKAKKSKSEEENKLPYVHVRARRGQATDSHSLAERARREKINARMKLLQELVPGCSNISGTALVLDEIINHVQSLQRQVEFLSMRLAAVNPRIDCSGLDNILSTECGRFTANGGRGIMPIDQSSWLDSIINGAKHQQNQQQIWLLDNQQPHQQQPQQQIWERDLTQPSHVGLGNVSINSHFAYDSSSPISGALIATGPELVSCGTICGRNE